MFKIKKVVLSLSIVFAMCVALAIGWTIKVSNNASRSNGVVSEVGSAQVSKPVKLNFEPGEVMFQKGGSKTRHHLALPGAAS